MEGNGELHAKGILHFTISVRDHVKASEFYADLLGCEVERVSSHFAFMKAGQDFFVLYRNPEHVPPNGPKGTLSSSRPRNSTGRVTGSGRMALRSSSPAPRTTAAFPDVTSTFTIPMATASRSPTSPPDARGSSGPGRPADGSGRCGGDRGGHR
jgi:hypothetical protein